MHKVDEVAARNKLPNGINDTNHITRSGPHDMEQKTDDQYTQKSQRLRPPRLLWPAMAAVIPSFLRWLW